jgi:hypothetical protein
MNNNSTVVPPVNNKLNPPTDNQDNNMPMISAQATRQEKLNSDNTTRIDESFDSEEEVPSTKRSQEEFKVVKRKERRGRPPKNQPALVEPANGTETDNTIPQGTTRTKKQQQRDQQKQQQKQPAPQIQHNYNTRTRNNSKLTKF